MRASVPAPARSQGSSSINAALLGYEFKVALKRNKAVLLKLYEKGRQVQPTDHVIRTVAPFTLRSPVVAKEVALLGDILDPNKTGFVTLKRVRELVNTHDDESEGEDAFEEEEMGSHLMVVSKVKSRPRQPTFGGNGKRSLETNRWVPPKRAPPTANASLYAVSTALSLVPNARDTSDPDMLAIMTAIQWSGKHLSQPSSIERRLIASTPLSKYAAPLSSRSVPHSREDIQFPLLSESLRRMVSDEDRGWVAAALIATHVRSEVVFRELVRMEVPEILVPEDILQSFLVSPRWYRQQLLDSTKPGSPTGPHEMFRSLSAVRLPLVVTTLKVEMDSASRKVVNAFLPLDVAGAWMRSSERERSGFVTALLDLKLWGDEFIAALGGSGMDDILLVRSRLALPSSSLTSMSPRTASIRDESKIRAEVERLMSRIHEVAVKTNEVTRPVATTDPFPSAASDEDDVMVAQLKAKIARFSEEIFL